MSREAPESTPGQLLLGGDDLRRMLWRLSRQLQERHPEGGVVLAGIVTRGVYVAWRLLQLLEPGAGWTGIALDCGPFRDDRPRAALPPAGPLPVGSAEDVEERRVVLVDDVLFHGRTARAALAALAALGRPGSVELLVLVDRGHRELPLRAGYVGHNLPTSLQEQVTVRLTECDGEDAVRLLVAEPSLP